MASSRMSRSTVHLVTSWPSLRSQAVIFRRPYRDSGFCAVSFSALTIVASATVRAQGLPADIQLRPDGGTSGKNGVVLTEVVQDHPHGTLTLILGVSLGHNRYPSQKRKRHQTRYGSIHAVLCTDAAAQATYASRCLFGELLHFSHSARVSRLRRFSQKRGFGINSTESKGKSLRLMGLLRFFNETV
jgi:hypothetical protein